MKRAEFLRLLEDTMELPGGSLRGDETLADLPEWDSLNALKFILLMQQAFGIVVEGEEVSKAGTIAGLLALAGDRISV